MGFQIKRLILGGLMGRGLAQGSEDVRLEDEACGHYWMDRGGEWTSSVSFATNPMGDPEGRSLLEGAVGLSGFYEVIVEAG